MKLLLAGILAVALVAGWIPGTAHADVMAFTENGVITSGIGVNNPVNLSLVFSVGSDISVTALGAYFVQNDWKSPETVGLYDMSRNLLAFTTIQSTDTLLNGYLFRDITPVTLIAGQQYIVNAFVGNNAWSSGDSPILDSRITYDAHIYQYSSGFEFPTQTTTANGSAYYAPNFLLTTVPEPSTYALLCISLGVVGYARRKMGKGEA
jgi:Domain of unknown function (DUF4082)/PEP-CTERM motif